jgi:hypothetical protein
VNLKAIELRTGLREISESGRIHPGEMCVMLRYIASPTEQSVLSSLLVPGSSTPPRAFWDALDYGEVQPVPVGAKLTAGEASDIRLAEAKADVYGRMDAIYAACLKVLSARMSGDA